MRAIALAVLLMSFPAPRAHGDFLRGDADQEGGVNVTDAVVLLTYLFEPGGRLACRDAADADDDGRIGLPDAVSVLNALFSEATLPSPGAGTPGPDPTCDRLDCEASPDLTPPVVISEIDYNPQTIATLEFVELHNRTNTDIDLGNALFTRGIDFTIPPGTVIPAGGFLLVVKDFDSRTWRRIDAKVGPYEGWLSDGGERLTFTMECGEETVEYDDRPPWPLAPDGYLRTLERIDYLSPAHDLHSWRAGDARGTPGEPNSSYGLPTHPMIRSSSISPERPSSRDEVTVSVVLDVAPESVESAVLHSETLRTATPSPGEPVEMAAVAGGDGWSRYEAVLPPRPSETLVRMNLELRLAAGRTGSPQEGDEEDDATLVLPHPLNPDAFLSYFVYDFEVDTALPLLWLFSKRDSTLPDASAQRSAAVALGLDADSVLVFDGAFLDPRRRSAGLNLKFLKGQEFRGDRTVNILPEEGNGGTGAMAPHMEYLGFDVWRALGGLAPRADWYRVIESSNSGRAHSQRLVVQQVNERFLEMNGFDPDGDLYKLDHKLGGWAKRTNLHTGRTGLSELLAAISRGTTEERREAIQNVLDVDNVRFYSVLSMLIGNWDGFHNNLFAYRTPSSGKWILVPWDLDQVFQVSLWNFTVEFPITSRNPANSSVNRSPGPISRPFHTIPEFHQAYLDGMKELLDEGSFSLESVSARIDAVERVLLEDVALQEALVERPLSARRAQIRNAHAHMKTYLERRVEYLREVLE